jgi:hypothetical protein
MLERLAVLIPRPRVNLVLYHGVLGARAAWRSRVVAFGTAGETAALDAALPDTRHPARPAAAGGRCWAELMLRSYGLDVLACPRCGGRLRLVALIDDRAAVARIIRHLGLPADLPAMRRGRPPPLVDEDLTP